MLYVTHYIYHTCNIFTHWLTNYSLTLHYRWRHLPTYNHGMGARHWNDREDVVRAAADVDMIGM